MRKVTLFICCILFVCVSIFAQSETEKGINLYKINEYKKAIDVLKKASKNDSKNSQLWYYLGLSQINENKLKDAEKSFKKAIQLDSTNAQNHIGLAYFYLLRNDLANAQSEAKFAVELNPKETESHYHYILGIASFRGGAYNTAYERAKKAIQLDSNFANAYFLKTEALVSSFIQQAGTVIRPTNTRGELLTEATADLEKYVSLSGKNPDLSFYKEYLQSVRFFAEYYNQPDRNIPPNLDVIAKPDPNQTSIDITSKPRASYTDRARNAGVSGTITLLVGFSEDAKIKNIMVIKSLGFGLDQEAIRAAKGIKFKPATKDGKPVSVVKMIQYSFSLY